MGPHHVCRGRTSHLPKLTLLVMTLATLVNTPDCYQREEASRPILVRLIYKQIELPGGGGVVQAHMGVWE
jgi:hypothetical protein